MLPRFNSRLPLYIAMATLGLGAWGLFLLHATNSERLASSPLRQITYELRNDERVKEVLGDRVRYAQNWWGESRRPCLCCAEDMFVSGK